MLRPPSWATFTFRPPAPPPPPKPHVQPAERYITTPAPTTLAELTWMYYRNPREWPRIYNANPWLTDMNGVIPAGTTLVIP